MIEDGFCNDETNNADCNYDGGDCCGTCTSMSQCTECACLGGADDTCHCKSNRLYYSHFRTGVHTGVHTGIQTGAFYNPKSKNFKSSDCFPKFMTDKWPFFCQLQ